MSHYVLEELEIKDLQVLLDALVAMGFSRKDIIVGKRNLEGYQGDKREEVADVTLPRKILTGLSNDVGFVKQPGGKYKLVMSEYDRTLEKNYNTNTLTDFHKRLKINYTECMVKKMLKTAEGSNWSMKKTNVNGKTALVLVKR